MAILGSELAVVLFIWGCSGPRNTNPLNVFIYPGKMKVPDNAPMWTVRMDPEVLKRIKNGDVAIITDDEGVLYQVKRLTVN